MLLLLFPWTKEAGLSITMHNRYGMIINSPFYTSQLHSNEKYPLKKKTQKWLLPGLKSKRRWEEKKLLMWDSTNISKVKMQERLMPYKILLLLNEALDIQIKWCICTQEISKISNMMKTLALATAMEKKRFEVQTNELIFNCFKTYLCLKSWRKYNCIANTRLKLTGRSDPG